MKNTINQFSDEVAEFVKDAGKGTAREIKSFGKIAKSQITGQQPGQDNNMQSEPKAPDNASNPKKDPITGKKPPTTQQFQDIKTKTAQLQMAQLKKVRDELAKQRLKVSGQDQGTQTGVGPEVKQEDKKPKDDAVKNTLKGSKSTGEFKGLVGG